MTLEDRPAGLGRFMPMGQALGDAVFDPVANAIAGLRYMQARYGEPPDQWLFGRQPVIFGAYRRWRSPWWARVIAWGIAVLYAVRSVRG